MSKIGRLVSSPPVPFTVNLRQIMGPVLRVRVSVAKLGVNVLDDSIPTISATEESFLGQGEKAFDSFEFLSGRGRIHVRDEDGSNSIDEERASRGVFGEVAKHSWEVLMSSL